MRSEAIAELEKAINSTKLKLQNEEVDLATIHAPEENEASRKRITEVKELIADMEQRVSRCPPPPYTSCSADLGRLTSEGSWWS